MLNYPETLSFDISLPTAFQALPPGGMAPSVFSSWQDPTCVAGAEVAHEALDEGQWALGAVAPKLWESKVPMRLFCSYTTCDKDIHSHVLLSRCNSKIIALNCGAFHL